MIKAEKSGRAHFACSTRLILPFAILLAPVAAHAECPFDCGAVGISLTWFTGTTSGEARMGYLSQERIPIDYRDRNFGTTSYSYSAEIAVPLRFRALLSGDVRSSIGTSYFATELHEDYTSPQMANTRFHASGTQYLNIGLYDAFTGNFNPDYGARWSLDATSSFGELDINLPALRVDYNGTSGTTRSYGLLPSLKLFGDSTPGACGEALGESCFSFSHGRYTFTPFIGGPGIPEPASWAMMIIGFGMAGGALRQQRKAFATAI